MAHTQPSVHWTWIPSHFSLLPANIPQVVPPPLTEASLRAPFGINKNLYNFALRPEIPILFSIAYVLSVFYLNAYNKRRNNEPWNVSKRKEFGYFVVAHNIVLAVYSFATFVAMGRAIGHSLPDFGVDNYAVRVADGLCKLHGPRGLGDAATFNTTINIWEVKNTAIKLTGMGIPDPTDVGRLWNEGLAFWGWVFYVSKFYEVLDTFIILAKGKRSRTLQTYHHAGAMLCMWAGIRYMSPPIWMFVFVNSGIHALMYTYFSLSSLGYAVPQYLKRTLTILQITQFIWGASYAAAHLFVQYDIPITTPFLLTHEIKRAVTLAQSAASSATSAVTSAAQSPIAAATGASFLKKLLLRAAGEEGVAERLAYRNSPFGSFQDPLERADVYELPATPKNVPERIQHFIEHKYETRYHHDWNRINCIDTSGEAFAIYLNLLYLSPLTWLFVRFFIRAYTQRGEAATRKSRRSASQALHDAAVAAREANKGVKDEFDEVGEKAEDKVEKGAEKAEEKGTEVQQEVRKDVENVVEQLRSNDGLKTTARQVQEKAKEVAESVKSKVEEATSSSTTSTQQNSSTTEASSHEESSSSSSFKQQEQMERQSSSTWIKGGAGLFRRDTGQSSQQADGKVEEDSDAMGKSGALVEKEDGEEEGKEEGS